jgi:hypothetical protein
LLKEDLDELRSLRFQEKKKDKEIRDRINSDFQNLNRMYNSKFGFYPLRLDPNNSSVIFDLTVPKEQSIPNKIFDDIQTPLGATNIHVEPIDKGKLRIILKF